MSRPRLLDLFCGAGGAGMGYHRAGFDVVGVDLRPQPRYPFEFHQADALTFPLDGFDAIHASPPCQAYTTANARYKGQGGKADSHPELIAPMRARLVGAGVPYVIENVEGAAAHMNTTIRLTGAMFGLKVHRPRLFESNVLLMAPRAPRHRGVVIGVYGARHDGRMLNSRCSPTTGNRAAKSLEEGRQAMGIDWMEWRELCESIPPAYCEFIGEQLVRALEVAA